MCTDDWSHLWCGYFRVFMINWILKICDKLLGFDSNFMFDEWDYLIIFIPLVSSPMVSLQNIFSSYFYRSLNISAILVGSLHSLWRVNLPISPARFLVSSLVVVSFSCFSSYAFCLLNQAYERLHDWLVDFQDLFWGATDSIFLSIPLNQNFRWSPQLLMKIGTLSRGNRPIIYVLNSIEAFSIVDSS